MRQAHSPDEPPRLIDLLAAAAYLIGLVIVGFLVIFGIPALLWIVAVSL